MDLEKLYELFQASKGVVTDSRKNVGEKIFFALKGPNFNGNLYATEVLAKGASYAVVSEKLADDERMILVDDVLLTLQNLATKHRIELGTPILGITGTNGKTTNKELISAILSKKYNCYSTKGNLNNHIGVPLSLLELTKEHDFAVIEMGANKLGDIKELSQIVDPDFGFITNIGLAHLEGFGSKENIAFEKGELFRFVKKKNGKFFVNSSEPEVVEIANDYLSSISVGCLSSDQYQFDFQIAIPEVVFEYKGHRIVSSLYGSHNYENLKMAVGIGLEFGVKIDHISEAISEYKSSNNRSQVEVVNGINILLDAYNANPSSTKASIQSFSKFENASKVLILGDMLELGDDTELYHQEILELVRENLWKKVVLIGPFFSSLQQSYRDYNFFMDRGEANGFINSVLMEGDFVLVKASRGIALEKLEFIEQQK